MKATFVDLRKKSAQILRALDRNERVTIFYRGRPKAVMHPIGERDGVPAKAADHEAFGMWKDRVDLEDPSAHVRRLRRGRVDGL